MTPAEDFFLDIARQNPALKLSNMFGSPCLKTPGGKSAAMFWKDCNITLLLIRLSFLNRPLLKPRNE